MSINKGNVMASIFPKARIIYKYLHLVTKKNIRFHCEH